MNERDYTAIGRDQLIRENIQLHEQVTSLQRDATTFLLRRREASAVVKGLDSVPLNVREALLVIINNGQTSAPPPAKV